MQSSLGSNRKPLESQVCEMKSEKHEGQNTITNGDHVVFAAFQVHQKHVCDSGPGKTKVWQAGSMQWAFRGIS